MQVLLCARPVAPTPPLKKVNSRWKDPGASAQLQNEHGISIAHKSDYSNNAYEKLPNQNSISQYRDSFDSKKQVIYLQSLADQKDTPYGESGKVSKNESVPPLLPKAKKGGSTEKKTAQKKKVRPQSAVTKKSKQPLKLVPGQQNTSRKRSKVDLDSNKDPHSSRLLNIEIQPVEPPPENFMYEYGDISQVMGQLAQVGELVDLQIGEKRTNIVLGGDIESQSQVKYHGDSPEQAHGAKIDQTEYQDGLKYNVNDPFDGNPESKVAQKYVQPVPLTGQDGSPKSIKQIPLPKCFEPSICLIVNNEYDLRKFLAECLEDIDNFAPNSMFNLKLGNYSQTLSKENLHISAVSKSVKSKSVKSGKSGHSEEVYPQKVALKTTLGSVKSNVNLDVIQEANEPIPMGDNQEMHQDENFEKTDGMSKHESDIIDKNNMIYQHQHPLVFEFKPKVYVTNKELFEQIEDKKQEIDKLNATLEVEESKLKQPQKNEEPLQKLSDEPSKEPSDVQVELPPEYTPLAEVIKEDERKEPRKEREARSVSLKRPKSKNAKRELSQKEIENQQRRQEIEQQRIQREMDEIAERASRASKLAKRYNISHKSDKSNSSERDPISFRGPEQLVQNLANLKKKGISYESNLIQTVDSVKPQMKDQVDNIDLDDVKTIREEGATMQQDSLSQSNRQNKRRIVSAKPTGEVQPLEQNESEHFEIVPYQDSPEVSKRQAETTQNDVENKESKQSNISQPTKQSIETRNRDNDIVVIGSKNQESAVLNPLSETQNESITTIIQPLTNEHRQDTNLFNKQNNVMYSYPLNGSSTKQSRDFKEQRASMNRKRSNNLKVVRVTYSQEDADNFVSSYSPQREQEYRRDRQQQQYSPPKQRQSKQLGRLKQNSNSLKMPIRMSNPKSVKKFIGKSSLTTKTAAAAYLGLQNADQKSPRTLLDKQNKPNFSRIQSTKINRMQENIKKQFSADNDNYLSNLLSQKAQEKYYLARGTDNMIHSLKDKINQRKNPFTRPAVNLSVLLRTNMERHKRINPLLNMKLSIDEKDIIYKDQDDEETEYLYDAKRGRPQSGIQRHRQSGAYKTQIKVSISPPKRVQKSVRPQSAAVKKTDSKKQLDSYQGEQDLGNFTIDHNQIMEKVNYGNYMTINQGESKASFTQHQFDSNPSEVPLPPIIPNKPVIKSPIDHNQLNDLIARSHHILQQKRENLDLIQSQQEFLTMNELPLGQYVHEKQEHLKKKKNPKQAKLMNTKLRQSSGKPYQKGRKNKVLASSVASSLQGPNIGKQLFNKRLSQAEQDHMNTMTKIQQKKKKVIISSQQYEQQNQTPEDQKEPDLVQSEPPETNDNNNKLEMQNIQQNDDEILPEIEDPSDCPLCLRKQQQLESSFSAEYINNVYQTYQTLSQNQATESHDKLPDQPTVPPPLLRLYPNLENFDKFQYICEIDPQFLKQQIMVCSHCQQYLNEIQPNKIKHQYLYQLQLEEEMRFVHQSLANSIEVNNLPIQSNQMNTNSTKAMINEEIIKQGSLKYVNSDPNTSSMPASSVPASKSISKISEPLRPIETHHTQNNYFEETQVKQKSPMVQIDDQAEADIDEPKEMQEVRVRKQFSPKSPKRKSRKSSKSSSKNMSPSMAYTEAVLKDHQLQQACTVIEEEKENFETTGAVEVGEEQAEYETNSAQEALVKELQSLQEKVSMLKNERQQEAQSLLDQKKEFLNQYKHHLPDEERKKLIREINQELKEKNEKYQLLEF